MKNHIAEDLPARKFAPAAAGSAPVDRNNKKENSGKTPEERAKQAVYDIRYKARREDIPLRQAYSEYMQNSSMAGQERNMVKAKLFGKEGGGMKAEDFNPIFKNVASDNVAKALFKVFVEGTEQEQELISLTYLEEFDNPEHRKYKVRVTDKNTKKSYVRYATREKINQLRANPNIESVEMTEYGEPYEGERKRGEQTARVTRGNGLDPVGKEDGDVNNDGKVNKTDNYLMKRRGAIGNAIATRKEEFIHEAGRKKKSKKSDPLDVRTGIHNKVNTSPTQGGNERVGLMAHNELEGELIAETGYSKFLKKVHSLEEMSVSINQQQAAGAALGAKRGETDPSELKGAAREMYDSMTEKQLRDFAKTPHEGLPEKVKEEMNCGSEKKNKVDNRSLPTQISIAKNIVRSATGIKNPMVMVSNDEDVKEGLGLSVGSSQLAGRILANPRTSAEQGAKNLQRNVTDPIGRAVKGAVRSIVQPANNSPEAKKARENKYRPEEIEFKGELVDESRLGDRAKKIEDAEAEKGGLRRTRSNREKIAGGIRRSQNVDSQGDLGRQKAPKDTGLHKGATRSSSKDDETPRRNRRRDDNPALTARDRNPNLR
jgi:hypothetical protein